MRAGRAGQSLVTQGVVRVHTRRVSTVGLVVLIVLALLVLLFVGGLIAARRRAHEGDARLRLKVAAADRALEAARAADRGWDPILLEEAARSALELARPGWRYDALHLVLVDDRPGTEADRAEMAAVAEGEVVSVVVTRHGDTWSGELTG
jgi:hypothetical protein